MVNQGKPKLFYGWVVVFSILCLQGAAIGILGNTMSVFFRPVSEALGVSRSTFYLYNTFSAITGMVMSPFWGEFFRNRKFKPYMILGSFTAAGTVFAYSYSTSIYHFYAIAMVNACFSGMLMGVSIARILANWFIEKRGLATGIALSGSGLAGAIMTPIVSRTIENYGWRAGYRQLGICFFVITVPILVLLLKETPEEMGLKPLGWKPQDEQVTRDGGTLKSGMTRAQALRSKTFWCYALALFMVQGCVMSTSNNVVNHLTDIGYSPAFAAGIFSILLFMLVPGKPFLGFLYDRLGMARATTINTLTMSVAPILLACTAIFRQATWLPYLYAVWFGSAYAITSMQLPYMTPQLFGDKEFTRVYGIAQPFTMLGSALLVPVANRAQEMIGSYVPVFFALSGGILVALGLMHMAIRAAPEEIARFDREDGIAPAAAVPAATA